MVNIQKINPMARAIGVIGAVAALVTATTFAALTSNSVALDNSQFSTQSASLKIWNGAIYTTSATGFDFDNLALGTPSSEFTFWLQNDGTAPLTVSGLGAVGTYSGFVDFGQVNVEIRNISNAGGSPTSPVIYTFAQLLDGTPDLLPGNPLAAGAENQYGVKVTVNSGAVSGSSASVDEFDWNFTGTNP